MNIHNGLVRRSPQGEGGRATQEWAKRPALLESLPREAALCFIHEYTILQRTWLTGH